MLFWRTGADSRRAAESGHAAGRRKTRPGCTTTRAEAAAKKRHRFCRNTTSAANSRSCKIQPQSAPLQRKSETDGKVPKGFQPPTDVPLNPTALEAVRVSESWRVAHNTPAAGADGRVLYAYGAGLPIVVCAPLRVCIVELQAGEHITGEPQIGDSVRWNVSPAMYGQGEERHVGNCFEAARAGPRYKSSHYDGQARVLPPACFKASGLHCPCGLQLSGGGEQRTMATTPPRTAAASRADTSVTLVCCQQ